MNAEFRDRLQPPNTALDSALSNVSRKLHTLDIVFPQIARIRKFPHQAPEDALVLADLVEQRAAALILGARLLRCVAMLLKLKRVQESRKAEQAAKESPDALR